MSIHKYTLSTVVGIFVGAILAGGAFQQRKGVETAPTEVVSAAVEVSKPQVNTRKLGSVGGTEIYDYRPAPYIHCLVARPGSSKPAISCVVTGGGVDGKGLDFPPIQE